ncbi:putative protein phosphatase 2C 24 [Hordeum vulgare subsp. vulgare]|uniref:putative protein phosphatase 2C 24 n=1 Tax=Hordeum vulgare subsp. vulgare TaxID=112509 RepID=UPI001D1A4344|nr:putative protein phosphatase 2C 24 [Hordeum vulgare subsp. vulgare]
MEGSEEIQQTLSEIDRRTPDALRSSFHLGYRSPSSSSKYPDMDAFIASVLPSPTTTRTSIGVADPGVIGVADGVSAYSAKGVDAGAFSRSLMTSAHQDALETAPRPICPYTLLQRACEGVASSDIGFAVLRGGAIVHRSRAQLARFNCPLQLTAKGVDFITQAEVGETLVRDGDIVVVATDGLFDNMFDAELERVVRMGTVLGFSPKNMADIIVGIAYEMSWSKDKDSPFSVGYRNHTGSQRCGGKEDDITVVVAFVVSTQLAGVDKVEDDDAASNSNWMDQVKRSKSAYQLEDVLLPSLAAKSDSEQSENRRNTLRRSNSGPISRATGRWY